jgi:hypothetical protein
VVDFGELSCLGHLVCVPQNLRGASSSFVGAELGIAIICPATGASAEGARYCTYVVQEGIYLCQPIRTCCLPITKQMAGA